MSEIKPNYQQKKILQRQLLKIHKVRFVKYTPAPIVSMVWSPSKELKFVLVLLRQDGQMEIWKQHPTWMLSKSCRTLGGGNWTKLLWSKNNRVFVSGHSGLVIELDPITLLVKAKEDAGGGAVWDIALNPSETQLVAACDDGGVTLFDINGRTLIYEKRFVKVSKTRMLSIAWDKNNHDFCYSGCADGTVKKWQVSQSRCLETAWVGKDENQRNIRLWCLLSLSNHTLVSGDSLGNVIFWDTATFTIKRREQSHRKDILCLTIDEQEISLFAAGVERSIQLFQRPIEDGVLGDEFISTNRYYNNHHHDVRAMAFGDSSLKTMLFTGGMDSLLKYRQVDPGTGKRSILAKRSGGKSGRQYRDHTLPWDNLGTVCQILNNRVIVARESNSLKFWMLPVINDDGRQVLMRDCFFAIELAEMNKVEDFQVDPTNSYLAVCTSDWVKLFHLQMTIEDKQSQVKVLKRHCSEEGARLVKFTNCSRYLITASPLGHLVIYDTKKLSLICTINAPMSKQTSAIWAKAIRSIHVSKNWIISLDAHDRIMYYHFDSFKAGESKVDGKIIKHERMINCVNIHKTIMGTHMVIVGTETEMRHFCTVFKLLPREVVKDKDAPIKKTLRHSIQRISIQPSTNSSYFYFWSFGYFGRVPYVKIPRFGQLKKRNFDRSPVFQLGTSVDITKKFRSIIACDFLTENEVVMVERPIFELLEHLPPAYYKAKFGTT